MLCDIKKIAEVHGGGTAQLLDKVLASDKPLLIKGLIADWPLVQQAKRSNADADQYLRHYYNGADVLVYAAEAEHKGRIFYTQDMTDFNFRRDKKRLDTVLDTLKLYADSDVAPTYYIGSVPVDYCLPDFKVHNHLPLEHLNPRISIWLGNQTRIAAHYDIPNNIACVAVGKRRFTLFPPEQLENLYVGPLDFTPAGQAISLVDFVDPDYEKHPKFKEALKHAQSAELEAGDAIYIPGMWWHHVEGLKNFNVLINYWWQTSPDFAASPLHALDHALLSIRDLPKAQRKIWKNIFQYYVFDADDAVTSHIPPHRRGVLAPIDDETSRKLRNKLLNQLNI